MGQAASPCHLVIHGRQNATSCQFGTNWSQRASLPQFGMRCVMATLRGSTIVEPPLTRHRLT